jgi:hypothetical protein
MRDYAPDAPQQKFCVSDGSDVARVDVAVGLRGVAGAAAVGEGQGDGQAEGGDG